MKNQITKSSQDTSGESKGRELSIIVIKTYYETIIREYGAGTGVDKEINRTE